jgi:hypothetical protein
VLTIIGREADSSVKEPCRSQKNWSKSHMDRCTAIGTADVLLNEVAPSAQSHLALMAIRFALESTCSVFAMVNVSTSFLNVADILFSSTSSTGMRR